MERQFTNTEMQQLVKVRVEYYENENFTSTPKQVINIQEVFNASLREVNYFIAGVKKIAKANVQLTGMDCYITSIIKSENGEVTTEGFLIEK